MLGKVVGVGAVSLFQLLMWLAGGAYLIGRAGALLGRLDLPPEAAQQAQIELPVVTLGAVGMFVTYFLGGFLLYSAMFAAVGAMSSNEQEARQAQLPVMMLMMVAYFSMFALAGNPGSRYAIALSLIPFTAPIAMPVRWAAGNLPAWEIALSIVLLLGAIGGVTWVAGRIYRVGILMTGKRPGLRELVRWVRTT
jgi:ABC-2 type transport system permease protein